MALTVFLFKVSNISISKNSSQLSLNRDDQSLLDEPAAPLIVDENTTLLSAKVIFRGLSLWSNNVPVVRGEASFMARGQQPKKFMFNLAGGLTAADKIRIEFYTLTARKKRKKLLAIFDMMLELLATSQHIDLPDETLSDPNNYLMSTTVQMKLYYTPPNVDEQNATMGIASENQLTDWKNVFDEQGRHGGHRHRHKHTKKDTKLQRLQAKFIGRADDADTDSGSDADYAIETDLQSAEPGDNEKREKAARGNLELFQKSLGRYDGDPYEMNEWQIMVHVIQGRDFMGLELNPYVCVQIDDEKYYTAIHKSSNSPYFGEFFTFDFALPATQVMQKVLFFKVHHSKKIISTFTDTKPIAVFRLDIATVYNEKEHAFERRWAQLINPDNVEAPSGHLLLSISVTERGTPSRNLLNELDEDDDEIKPSRALIPAAMPHPLFPVQMKITFFTATELPEMMTEFLTTVSKKILQKNDGWEPIDPYVEVSYNTMQAKTTHINGTTPVWGEAFYLIGRFPPLIRTIRIAVKDHAAVQRDRVIASTAIDLFSISETSTAAGFLPTLGPTWMFLYGSPREYTTSKEQDGLNEGMGEAVSYKGRLLMEIECHPISGENTSNMSIQKQTGIQLPDASLFPMKRTFLLFGTIFDVTMIDKIFGNQSIAFEISIGSSGYLNPQQLVEATRVPTTSLTRAYPAVPLDNNKQYFRLPIDLQKPMLFTKYHFHDYVYRMTLTNRLKNAARRLDKMTREFESKIDSKVSNEALMEEYQKIQDYVHALPCGCEDRMSGNDAHGITPVVHPSLKEVLDSVPFTKINNLDEKRRSKLLYYLESVKAWISKKHDYEESKRFDIVKDLNQISRALRRMAFDAQPSLPDVFLWMISDSKRVAYTRIPAEDLLFNQCEGDKGLHNGRVQTFFLKTPRSTDKPLNPSTNAKVQIFLWLGIEEYEPYIYRQLPSGFDMPKLPLDATTKNLRYNDRHYYEVRCHLLKARALLASDDTGLSDPFLSVTVGTSTQTTPILLKSLCPQWNVTLAFPKLMHIGTPESAEQIIGNVVVECYDYDEDVDGPDLIGRFSTTAKLNLLDHLKEDKKYPFKWYEFKIGEKTAGELLAAFELIEIDETTHTSTSPYELEVYPLSPENFPPEMYVIKTIKKHLLYRIPDELMPPKKSYELEIMFWGLRECRKIGLQSIQQAEVTIECAGERTTRTIKDVQKYPNFAVSTGQPDIYILRVDLPNDNKYWPHLSILCVQNRLFGLKEIVGNLVVTDLRRYIERAHDHLTGDEELANAMNELSKTVAYDFNRVRRSIVDAYEAALAAKNKDIGKEKLSRFEKAAGADGTDGDSQKAIINADSLEEQRELDEEEAKKSTGKEALELKEMSTAGETTETGENAEAQPLKTVEKMKRDEMEKSANWWNKYYASKARMKLAQRKNANLYEDPVDSAIAYADFYDHRKKKQSKLTMDIWNKLKRVLSQAGKAQKAFQRLAIAQFDTSEKDLPNKSAFDESMDNIEVDRLQELTLLQTFDIVDTELENVFDYEGFHDCLETFALYKGKGSNRSDETGDEKRVYAKFKGKIRIRDVTVPAPATTTDTRLSNVSDLPRVSLSPSINPANTLDVQQAILGKFTQTGHQMTQFNLNEHQITLKCRLYLIKATIYRGWDASGKADPFIKIVLNDTTIIDDTKGRISNTLEPVFGKCYEFDVTIPTQNLLRVQIWDHDMLSENDIIAETKIDIENRFFSCHRATCGLPKRYDSAGYNAWRDTKKPTIILDELCRTTTTALTPIYNDNNETVRIGEQRFTCDPACVEFVNNAKSATTTLHRKVHHESPTEYIQQNTALAALHAWGRKINSKCALVAEHIESRSLYNEAYPETEQGKLEMWLDFFPMSRPPSTAPVDITPLKPTPYQLRLTIRNTHDVELNDENFLTGEKTSDIYVKAWILGESVDAQETDIHYRSLTGEGNFNWRFIFDFNYLEIEQKIVYEAKDKVFQVGGTVKKIPPRIVIRVYDADLLSADDFLGECVLNLTHLPLGAKNSKKCKADIVLNAKHPSVNLFVNRRLAGHWPLIAPKVEGVIRDKDFLGGKVEAEFSLVTAEEAEKNPMGKAREGPQPLDEPNRPKTSFLWFTSPWKTLRYVIWRNFKWPILIGIVVVIFVVFLLLAIWSLPGEIVRQVFTKAFKN